MRLFCIVGLSIAAGLLVGVACSSSNGSAPGGQTCTQRAATAENTISAIASEPANLACQSSLDCVVASNTTGCWYSCGFVLNDAGAAQLASAIAQLNATTCANFVADSCNPGSPPPCVGYLPTCIAGTCHDFPGLPGEDAGAGDAASDAGGE